MPEAFTKHVGTVAVLMIDNVDTDQIIPSREMKTVGRDGLADGLFAGWRYVSPGGREPAPDFVLNQPGLEHASILVSGENFGCGSSREHAAWALAEFGIRAIVAKSFGEIFHGNCIRNGILPITLADENINWKSGDTCTVDLEAQTVSLSSEADWTGHFEIGTYPKKLLLNGLDPIGLTLMETGAIEAFFAEDQSERPWVYSAA